MRRYLAPLAAFCCLAGPASAQSVTVGENAIISLASAPEILSAKASVDDAGRPALSLSLRFANDCYAGAGANVELAETAAGPLAIVLQRTPANGCPEIFQPVTSNIVALLPSRVSGASIRVVGKPAVPGLVRTLSFERGSPGGGAITEAQPITAALPAIAVSAIAPAAQGYSVAIETACQPQNLRAQLFEIPDDQGNPSFDLLLLTSTGTCEGAPTRTEVTVQTPQPNAGRSVYIANDSNPAVRPLQ